MSLNDPMSNGRQGMTPRRGFTLVELLMALFVGGIAILGARSVLANLADHADRVVDVAAAVDRAANGERALRALLADLDLGAATPFAFGGDESEAHFTSWCSTPSGWKERCLVRLAVLPGDSARDRSTVAVVFSTGETLELVESSGALGLRYLRDATNGGTWFRRWGTGITAPIAIGIVGDRDTLILRIGERG